MRIPHCMLMAGLALALAWPAAPAAAQGTDTYRARLEWVPTTTRDRPNVQGRGSATGTLSGRTLRISGSFEGVPQPATKAELHLGVAMGARGSSIAELTISKTTSGSITGSVDLTPEQVDALGEGRLYVQVYTEGGVEEDGSTLRGWFLRPR